MRTSDGGSVWDIKFSGVVWLNSVYCKGYDSAIVGGGGGCILKLYNSLTGGITWFNQVPEKFTIDQNYPNPFNPVTTIKFGLPTAAKVTLKVFDILGREVSILYNNNYINAGIINYNFDASELAAGIYIYTLIINDNAPLTKKMIFVK